MFFNEPLNVAPVQKTAIATIPQERPNAKFLFDNANLAFSAECLDK